MTCPQCGYKIKQQMCPYCNITKNEIAFASNLKAKKLLKANLKDDVLFSTFVPRDINKIKMTWLTLFLGCFGAGNFYSGRFKRGWFILISFVSGFFLTYMKLNHFNDIGFLNNVASIGGLFAAFAVIMWFSDFFAVLFNKYNYPIVLADSEEVKKAEQVLKEQFKKISTINASKKNKKEKISNSNNNIKKDKTK